MYNLPVRCTRDMTLVDDTAQDGGWSVVRNLTASQVEDIMSQYPRSAMPCWKRWAHEKRAFLSR